MNSHEDLFRQDLSDIPPVPEGMFGAIENRIRRRQRMVRTVWTAACSLMLLLGGLTVTTLRLPHPPAVANAAVTPQAVSDDAVKELQRVRDYLNGNDVEAEVAVYAVAYDE
jgi:hypothetical protein